MLSGSGPAAATKKRKQADGEGLAIAPKALSIAAVVLSATGVKYVGSASKQLG